ncbi:MAG: sigma 54-interacting transcriptional regulator [Proteobacteria bacterium]|nr:sigma 54-interacting transcriptional regulator [Pseudomonadota bacterium]MBU1742387.1 sigma 54-interacting transcriptional regulator [Pseudomonadota bacterium]
MFYLEIIEESGSTRRVTIQGDQCVIGREAPAEVVIPDEKLLPRQAVVRRLGDVFLVEDTSGLGVIIDGQNKDTAEIAPGDVIEILDYRLRVWSEEAPEPPDQMDDYEADKTVMIDLGAADERNSFLNFEAQLVINRTDGQVTGQVYHMDRERITIGRHPDNDVSLPDPHVSGRHVEVFFVGGEYRVKDLGSTNGTLLDGRRVVEAPFSFGSSLGLGPYTLTLGARGEEEEALEAPETLTGLVDLVGTSLAMQRVYSLIRRAAKSDATVIIEGPTGSGKELAARAIHALSRRSTGPFSTVDCGSIPETLIESELFGHEKGAFTGAVGRRAGAFEVGHGGTVFLDEIGELPLQMQPKLLRFLEERTLKRVGGTEVIDINTRVIAATHRRLVDMVREGKFREDLYFRLFIIPIALPPLAARTEDIPLLVRRFVEQGRREAGLETEDVTVPPEAMARLMAHPWPGNVRELKNVILRALVMADGPTLGPEHIQFSLAAAGAAPGDEAEAALDVGAADGGSLADVEKRHIQAVLVECGGNKKAAAQKLGIALSTLYDKLKRYGLQKSD